MQHPLPTRSNNSEGIHRLGAPFGLHPVEGQLRGHLRVTTRTTLDLGPVFRHLQRARRQIEDLAALVVQHRFPARTTSAALRTNCQRMNLNMVWLFNPSQGLTWVSGLAPGLAT